MRSVLAQKRVPFTLRVGLPLSGGALVRAARTRGLPVLFSANAFAQRYPRGHEREREFRRFRLPGPGAVQGNRCGTRFGWIRRSRSVRRVSMGG